MSPSSFNNLPPASPCKGAVVYFVLLSRLGITGEADAVEARDAEEDDRVKGLVKAVDRLNGFEEAGTGTGGG